MKYVLTVTLNPSVDKTVVVREFRTGREHRSSAPHDCAGGKGINVSRALRSLGIPSVATGVAGGPVGEFIRKGLSREGVRHNFSKIGGNNRVNVMITDPASGKVTRVIEPGPAVTQKELKQFDRKYYGLLKRASWAVFSGRLAPGMPEDYYAKLIREAEKCGVRCALDASGEALRAAVRQKPFLVKLNLAEAEEYAGRRLQEFDGIVDFLKGWFRKGIRLSAVTLGPRGAAAFDGVQVFWIKPPVSRREETVGCGDAFLAGWIASLQRGKSFADGLRMAVACATANVLTDASGDVRPAVVRRVLGRVRVKPVD